MWSPCEASHLLTYRRAPPSRKDSLLGSAIPSFTNGGPRAKPTRSNHACLLLLQRLSLPPLCPTLAQAIAPPPYLFFLFTDRPLPQLTWNSPHQPGWSHTHSAPPASTSLVLAFKACAITSRPPAVASCMDHHTGPPHGVRPIFLPLALLPSVLRTDGGRAIDQSIDRARFRALCTQRFASDSLPPLGRRQTGLTWPGEPLPLCQTVLSLGSPNILLSLSLTLFLVC